MPAKKQGAKKAALKQAAKKTKPAPKVLDLDEEMMKSCPVDNLWGKWDFRGDALFSYIVLHIVSNAQAVADHVIAGTLDDLFLITHSAAISAEIEILAYLYPLMNDSDGEPSIEAWNNAVRTAAFRENEGLFAE